MKILIIREEIVCILILLIILYYYIANGGIRNKNKNTFIKIVICALCHLVFEAITVLTVNQRDIVPDVWNRVAHIIFILTGIVFVMEFFRYVIQLAMPLKYVRRLRFVVCVPCILFVLLMPWLPIEYCSGNETDYSSGPLVALGFGICALYCIGSLGIMLIRRKWIEVRIKRAVVPINGLILLLILIQVMIPETLLTGAIVTLVSIGMFFSLDNPMDWLKKYAYWDMDVKIKNKNSFLMELDRLKSNPKNKNAQLGVLVADVNALKIANDKYGHAMGDRLIKIAAQILRSNLKSAYDVYRIGGDEFIAIYIQPISKKVQTEIEAVRKTCIKEQELPVSLSIAMGYAEGNMKEIKVDEILDRADRNMYKDKKQTKMLHPELKRS